MSYHDNVQQYTSCLRVCILGDPLEVRALGHSYLDASMSLLAQRNMTGYEADPNKQSPKELPRTARLGPTTVTALRLARTGFLSCMA